MTTAGHILHAERATTSAASLHAPLQLLAGFFFAFRFALTYVGFQSNPRAGSAASLVCSGLLLTAAAIYTLGDQQFSTRLLLSVRTLRWLCAYLAVSGLSLLWTGAESPAVAAGYWAGMVMDVATVVLLVKRPNIAAQTDALMKGFVAGLLLVALVAWLSPTQEDLRIGNDEFMHPNGLGLHCGLAFFMAQYLALEKRAWRWCCVALGITLLRSISKTSIAAFLIAESFYLLRERQISRWMKIKIATLAAVVIAAFGTLLESYLAAYTTTGAGDQTETLTGRTLVWASAFSIAIERPWIGHGLYSFRTLIPAFGKFEPWHAHNELLQQFFELGLFGVAVTAGLYLSIVIAAKRSSQRRYAILATVIALFAVVRGLADTMNFGLSFPLWLFAALGIALWQPAPEAIVS